MKLLRWMFISISIFSSYSYVTALEHAFFEESYLCLDCNYDVDAQDCIISFLKNPPDEININAVKNLTITINNPSPDNYFQDLENGLALLPHLEMLTLTLGQPITIEYAKTIVTRVNEMARLNVFYLIAEISAAATNTINFINNPIQQRNNFTCYLLSPHSKEPYYKNEQWNKNPNDISLVDLKIQL